MLRIDSLGANCDVKTRLYILKLSDLRYCLEKTYDFPYAEKEKGSGESLPRTKKEEIRTLVAVLSISKCATEH